MLIQIYRCNAMNTCMKPFYHDRNEQTHMEITTTQYLYQCNVCMDYFSLKAHLQHHKKLHTGEKPCKCDFCYKFFCQAQRSAHMWANITTVWNHSEEEKPTGTQTSTLERSLSNVMFVRGFMYSPESLLNIILYPVVSNNVFLLLVVGYHTHTYITLMSVITCVNHVVTGKWWEQLCNLYHK